MAEFRALPRQKPPLEYVDGVVYQRPLLSPTGSAVRGELTSALHQYGRTHQHGEGLGGVDCVTDETLLVPAVSYYCRTTLRARGIRSYREDWGVPDLALEIVPAEEPGGLDLHQKIELYFDLGVALVLLIDVEAETVQTLRRDQSLVVASGDELIDFGSLVPGFELTVRGLFDRALPKWLWGPRGGQAEDDAAASERPDASGG